MKNFFIVLLVVIIAGAGYYIYLSKTTFVPSIVNTAPNGGEDFKFGDRFRYSILTKLNKPGNVNVYLTSANNIEAYQQGVYFQIGAVDKKDINPDGLLDGSFVLSKETKDLTGKTILPGDYYLLSVWQSGDGQENLYDFTEVTFKISE